MKSNNTVINPKLLENRMYPLVNKLKKELRRRNEGKTWWTTLAVVTVLAVIANVLLLQVSPAAIMLSVVTVLSIPAGWRDANRERKEHDRRWATILTDTDTFYTRFMLKENLTYDEIVLKVKAHLQDYVTYVTTMQPLWKTAAKETEDLFREHLRKDFDLAHRFLGDDLDGGLGYKAFDWKLP